VYWADQDGEGTPMRFRQYLEQLPGEKVLLVDDLLRSGIRLTQLKKLVESNGATVVGLAVAVYQPNPSVADFGSLPLFYLAKMNATYYRDSSSCELCNRGVPVEKIWV
jgi:orotate phosphoribosyltransferase